MLEVLNFSWFLLQVLLSLAWMLFLSGVNRLKKYKVFIFLLAISINLLVLIWLNTSEKQKEILISPPTPPPYATVAKPQGLTRPEVDDKIKQLETTLELQPTHVDTIINLGLVYDSLGDRIQAEKYWSMAKEINPIHPFFDTLENPSE